MIENKNQSYEFIKEYLVNTTQDQIAWIGDSLAPISCTQVILNLSTNFRATPSHHNQYNVVFIFFRSIFEYYNSWKLILDESVRLLNQEGYLIIRSQDNEYGTLFELKSQLFRNNNLGIELIKQNKDNDGFTISVYKLKKINIAIYNDKSWTIGILSNGKKENIVLDLIFSLVKANHHHLPIEFIIAGPEIQHEKLHGLSIKFTNSHIQDELPRIADKKNNIFKLAKMTNIAIFHDRYIVNDDFFDGFESYGYNFEFLTIRQFYENGNEFPAYIAFPIKNKRWQSILNIQTHDQILPGSFINGGLIILKKGIFDPTPFNNLLLHNEAEDVELSFYLSEHGIIPRFNGFSSSTTVGIPFDYTSTFIAVSSENNSEKHKSPFMNKLNGKLQYVKIKTLNLIKKILLKTGLYEQIKNFIYYR